MESELKRWQEEIVEYRELVSVLNGRTLRMRGAFQAQIAQSLQSFPPLLNFAQLWERC